MKKEYTALGLMSGTSGDGIDASIIKTDGNAKYQVIQDRYFEYDNEIYYSFHDLKEKINNKQDLIKLKNEIQDLDRKITIFHSKVVMETTGNNFVDLIGFHGQTIYHNSKEKISKQLGDGKLLSQLVKKDVIFNFRHNDIKNGGEGAPLTPIFHQLIASTLNFDLPICILNIGGIANISLINKSVGSFEFSSKDIGPGNCLIDTWVRKNSDKKYDIDGILALKGNRNEIILEQAQELYQNRQNKDLLSFDVSDFDISFARGLSLEDGVATLTDFTANILSSALTSLLKKDLKKEFTIILCGGGRKNKVLMEKIKKNMSNYFIFKNIDDFNIDGDFVESQAFAYLAVRSILKLPITFPKTTGCNEPLVGGVLAKY